MNATRSRLMNGTGKEKQCKLAGWKISWKDRHSKSVVLQKSPVLGLQALAGDEILHCKM